MRARPGVTLVELLITLVISAVVLMAVFKTVNVQSKSMMHLGAVTAAAQTTRTAQAVLAAELREISASGGDLVVATADSLTVRVFRKIAVVCNPDAPGKRMDVWELGESFTAGDSLMVFADNDTMSVSDDSWRRARVVTTSSGTCSAEWSGGQTRRLQFGSLDSLKLFAVRRGSPLRAFTSYTYAAYYVDGKWVLGRRAGNGSAVALQGPLAPRSEGGLTFNYFDANGTQITPADSAMRAAVARVEIRVRSKSKGSPFSSGGAYIDSLATQLHLRNN